MNRGQANVVGVALLLAITVVSLGTLTAAVGTVVDDHASRADTNRVATALDDALRPVEATGSHRGRVSFASGTLRTVERDLRVLDGDGVVERVRVGGLVFEAGERRVGYVSGALVRGSGAGVDLLTAPPVTASSGSGGVLVVGAPRLGTGSWAVSGEGGTTVVLRTTVTHERTDLGRGQFRVAIETRTPGPVRERFRAQGATVTSRDIDGDGVPSVVARFPGERRAYLVVHDLSLEVAS